jgi:succinate dehydrogenase/fumarate reductase-like Fe-S protein
MVKMSQKLIKIQVSRFEPSLDQAPHFEQYEIPAQEGMSVMQALDYIYENLDDTLAYYDHAACAQGICGRCSVSINGKTTLLCQTLFSENQVVDIPAHNKRIKDLVYDRGGKES